MPTTSSDYCTHHSPIYSKLLDDSMSSHYDEPTAHCNSAAPAGARFYDPPADRIPRLHEAHPYWVLEQRHDATHPVICLLTYLLVAFCIDDRKYRCTKFIFKMKMK